MTVQDEAYVVLSRERNWCCCKVGKRAVKAQFHLVMVTMCR